MIRVYVKKQSNYPVSTPSLKKKLSKFLASKGITSKADVYVYIVGVARMKELAKKYLGERNSVHNVLSFPASEVKGKFVYPPDGVLHLGDIAVCYQKAFEEAKSESKLIDNKVYDLVEHGAMHLLGIHHD